MRLKSNKLFIIITCYTLLGCLLFFIMASNINLAYIGTSLGFILLSISTVLNFVFLKQLNQDDAKLRNILAIIIPILWLGLLYILHQEFSLVLLCFLPQLIYQLILALMTIIKIE